MKESTKNIVCFGEVLWDIYPDTKRLGGAPFNVAAHLSQLGIRSDILTKVGDDSHGNEILNAIQDQNVTTKYAQIDYTFPTGVVNVTLDSEGTPSYDIKQPSAWDFIHTNLDNLSAVKDSNGFVFGSLACRTERNLLTLRDLCKVSPLNICDLNIRQNFYTKSLVEELLQFAKILKLNEDESHLICELFDLPKDKFYSTLSSRFEIDIIIQTKGADGAEAYHQGNTYKNPGLKVKVIDTVGSGDAFLAAFIFNYLQGYPIDICLDSGCKLGAYVATQRGAIPKHAFSGNTNDLHITDQTDMNNLNSLNN